MPDCLIVASHFPPMRSAGVFRTIRIARYLPDHDWSVRVLTVDPAVYLAGSSCSEELLARIPACVEIHRTKARHPLEWMNSLKSRVRSYSASSSESDKTASATANETPTGNRSRSLRQKAKDAITVPLMTPDRWIGWLPFAVQCGKRLLAADPTDVIYSSGPPWTNHLVAERLCRKTATPWVADFRDPWLGNNFRPQRQGNGWVGRKHQRLERSVVETASVVILNTSLSHQSIVDRYPDLPSDKFITINNAFDPADFQGIPETQNATTPARQRPLRLVHTGAFYGKRNIDALLQAIGNLMKQRRITASDLVVDLIGAARPGREREESLAAEYGISDLINVMPPIPHEQCLASMRDADVLLLVQTDAPLCIPGKAFEYLAFQKPILTLAGKGATAELVLRERLGPCVDPADLGELESVIESLVRQFHGGTLASPEGASVDRYNGEKQIELFDQAFRRAIRSRRQRVSGKEPR